MLGACSSPSEVLVQVSAPPELLGLIGTVEMRAEKANGTSRSLDIDVSRQHPACFPFSFSFVGENLEAEEEVTIRAEAQPRGGAAISIGKRFPMMDGLRLLELALPSRCWDPNASCDGVDVVGPLPEIDRDEMRRRIAANVCDEAPTPLECLNAGGCLASEATPACLVPCPENDPPNPPMPPATPELPMVSDVPLRLDPVPSCPTGQASFVGERTCVTIGNGCPAGPFATLLPGGTRTYVDPTADGTGDGSIGAPDRTIGAALARGTDVVMLSKGTHVTAGLTIDRTVAIVGACAAQTTVDGAIDVAANGVLLRDLSVASVNIGAGAAAELSGVAATDALVVAGDGAVLEVAVAGAGVDVSGMLGGEKLVVDGAPAAALSGTGRFDLTNVTLVRSASGLSVDQGAVGTLRTAIFETITGVALDASGAAAVTVESALLRDGRDHAIRAADNASVTIIDATVEAFDGSAVTTGFGTTFSGRGMIVTDVTSPAIELLGDSELRDVTATETREDGDSREYGVVVEGVATFERIHVDRVDHVAMQLTGTASVTMFDVDVGDGPTANGSGIDVRAGATAKMTRVRIRGARSGGVRVETSASGAADVRIDDLIAEDTRAGTRADGIGLVVGRGDINIDHHQEARVVVNRASIVRSVGAGIGLSRCRADLFDIHVRETTPRRLPRGDFGGYGIVVTNGGLLEGDRVELLANRDAGIYVGVLEGSTALTTRGVLTNAKISGTTCDAEQGGCQFFRGAGAGVSQGGEIELRRFLLDGNQYAGIFLFFVGRVDASDGTISNHPIGVDVKQDGYDVSRVMRRVRYVDNVENFFTVGQ